MRKQLILIGIIALLVGVGLSGCTNEETQDKNGGTQEKEVKSNAELLIGRWTATNGWAQFDEDGTYTKYNSTLDMSLSGTYELQDDILHMEIEYQGNVQSGYFTIEFLDDNTLKTTDEDGIVTTQTRII